VVSKLLPAKQRSHYQNTQPTGQAVSNGRSKETKRWSRKSGFETEGGGMGDRRGEGILDVCIISLVMSFSRTVLNDSWRMVWYYGDEIRGVLRG